jgi:hypothetical protein
VGSDRIRATTGSAPIAKPHRSGAGGPAVRAPAPGGVSAGFSERRGRTHVVSRRFRRSSTFHDGKKAFLRLFFTFSNGVRSLRFAVEARGLEKQMSVENVLELSNGAPLSRQFVRAFAEPATTRARSPRVARVARPRAFVAFPAR